MGPAILAMRDGREFDAYSALIRLTDEQRKAARIVLGEGATSQGWFSEWCREGIELLDACPSTSGRVKLRLTAVEAKVLRTLLDTAIAVVSRELSDHETSMDGIEFDPHVEDDALRLMFAAPWGHDEWTTSTSKHMITLRRSLEATPSSSDGGMHESSVGGGR